MKKDIIIFKDGTSFPIESGSHIGSIKIISNSKKTMLSNWDCFTNKNLSEVQFKTSSGLTVGTYYNLVLISETSSVLPDGSISTIYCLREKTLDEKRLDVLEQEQDIQNGAISDLGEITSSLAEGLEGGLA